MTFHTQQIHNLRLREAELERLKFQNRILRRLAEITWAVGLIHSLDELKRRRYMGDKWANRNRTSRWVNRNRREVLQPQTSFQP